MGAAGHNRNGDTAVIFVGGDPADVTAASLENIAGFVIAADSGLDEAQRIGVVPDLVIGDLDSVSPAALALARGEGVAVQQHPRDKEATDLELALDAALSLGWLRVVVVGGYGGRLSHLLGNATLLASPRYRSLEIQWWLGPTTAHVTHAGRPAHVKGAPGDLVSLVTIGDVEGVTTTGLKWVLEGDRLAAGTSRAISNELNRAGATVTVGRGTLIVIIEGGGS